MSLYDPTTAEDHDHQGGLGVGGGHSESLDADRLPEEFPDDRPLAARDYGTTEAEQARRESLDRRLRREEPEPDLTAELDLDDDVDDDDSPDLLADLDDDGGDMTKELTTVRARRDRRVDDSGQLRSPRSAEEDAIHVVDEDPALDDPALDDPALGQPAPDQPASGAS